MSSTTMASSSIRTNLKTLKETSSPESKTQALTYLRRLLLDDQKILKNLSEEDFCELCNVVINVSLAENVSEKLHAEALRTLDTILPETRHKNFDFFQSILQINRKKRLKILLSLSVLKDETMAVIASKLSILEFLSNCLESIYPKTMIWLQPENAENVMAWKSGDKALDDNEEFENRIVESTLILLCRLCGLSSSGLSIKQFDTFMMDKVVLLAFMGNERQRFQALKVLQVANSNDLGTRVRSFHKEIWDQFKQSLQITYCKRMTLLVNQCSLEWAQQWETSIALVGTDLHKGSALVNSLLKVEELAFKSGDVNRKQAFLTWKYLIDNFALDPRELATMRRIKLLCVPLNAKNSKSEIMVFTKMEVWWHLINKIYHNLAEFSDAVLIPFLTLCFGPFSDKPLFVQVNDSNVALGKKFHKTQIFSIGSFAQLIVSKENTSKISISVVNETLPNSINNAVFEKNYKTFIHCFGEILIIMGLLSNDSVKNKFDVCHIIWESLMIRIEAYDKMKLLMYKEIASVITELIKNQFHKIPLIKDFFVKVILKNFSDIASSAQLTENIYLELANIFTQIDDFSGFTKDHFKSLQLLLSHSVKPSSANVYYPKTLELMKTVINTINRAKQNDLYMPEACEIWCILARIAKQYIEDDQPINEGTLIDYNFETIESILNLPFSSININDLPLVKMIAEAWRDLYKVFDYQAELIVAVKPNIILEKTSKMIIPSVKINSRFCDLAAICIDTLLAVVNYDYLPSEKEVPEFVNLLKIITLQCIHFNSFGTDQVLKAFNSFLLRVFNHSPAKTVLYLKTVESAVNVMIAKIGKSKFDNEILKIWTDIVGLMKRLQKSLNYELLNCYQKTIIAAASNPITSTVTLTISEVSSHLDEKTKKLMEDIVKELDQVSAPFKISETKDKVKKKATPVGSFLGRKTMSPAPNTPEPNFTKPKVINVEPESQDFIVINSEVKLDVNRMTEHQKEKLKKRRDDIPALYNELTVSNSQDSQQLQHWFDAKAKSSTNQKINNNETTESALPSTFKNITQVLSQNQDKTTEKSPTTNASSPSASSSKIDESAIKTTIIRESTDNNHQQPSNCNNSNGNAKTKITTEAVVTLHDHTPSVVAKKLNFDNNQQHDELAEQQQQISPSIIEGVKGRRKSSADELAGTPASTATDKLHKLRRSTGQLERGTLKKYNSSDQLPQAGKKRRNSESNSDGTLSIARAKKPKIYDSLEVCNSLDSNEETTKNLSKRTKIELSRLQIDMVFEALPNRRSISKENSINDKKLKDDKITGRSREDKISTPAKAKDIPGASVKSKDDKGASVLWKPKDSITPIKLDNSQQQKVILRRRSLKGFDQTLDPVLVKIDGKQKDSYVIKKDKKADNAEVISGRMTRKSLPEKVDNVTLRKKNDTQVLDTQDEEVDIEDVSTQTKIVEKKEKNTLPKLIASDEVKATQDPDIVESSQEPSFNAKFNKPECIIKIKKVELVPKPMVVDKLPEKQSDEIAIAQKKIINETPIDPMEKTQSDSLDEVIIETVTPVVQVDTKKVENNVGKVSLTKTNHVQIPKSPSSRTFKQSYSLGGRAAWMVDLVTKKSLGEKLSSSETVPKSDFNLTDEVTIVPLKKDKTIVKENERISSPISSRQSKMFNNMNNLNNLKVTERSSSPSIMTFSNLKNDGERISPKLEKHLLDKESETINAQKELFTQNEASDSDDSTKEKDLPILEWSNANPPSLTASPSVSILKRLQESEIETPGNKKKRVSFADPPVSRKMGYEIMVDTSSPPRNEKSPSIRSPVSHGTRRMRRRIEREINDTNNDDKSTNLSPSPKIKLLTKIESHEVRDISGEGLIANTQDDMFDESTVPALEVNKESEEAIEVAAIDQISPQTEANNSSSKLDFLNISNISGKSDQNRSVSLEDTVDVSESSTSFNTTDSVVTDNLTSSTSQSRTQTDSMSVTDSVFSDQTLTQESQSSIAQLNKPEMLDSTMPVYPSLTFCNDPINVISAELVDPMFVDDLTKHFSTKSIHSIGELAQLTEREINRLPIISPKIACVKKVLSRYEERLKIKSQQKKKMKTVNCISSSTPLEKKQVDRTKLTNDSNEELSKSDSSDLDSSMNGSNKRVLRYPKRSSADNSMQTSPVKRSKKDDEKACVELMAQCNDDFLLQEFVKRFDCEKVLQEYKINSLDLLSFLAKNLAQEKSKGINGPIPETADLQSVLNHVPSDTLIEEVKLRKDLKSSDELLNIVLENNADESSVLKKVIEVCKPATIIDVYSDWCRSKIIKVHKK